MSDDHAYDKAVGEALATLIPGLTPLVERVIAEAAPGVDWTEILRRKDLLGGRRAGTYSSRDLSLVLRIMTERLGDLGFPFSAVLPRQALSYASELREVRNQWAHNQPFDARAAYRAIDSAQGLLEAAGATAFAEQVAAMKSSFREPSELASPNDSEPSASNPAGDALQDGQADHPANPSGVRIAMTTLPVLSYAMAHCRVPIIDQISIDNDNHDGDVRNAMLEVEVRNASGSLSRPIEIAVDLAGGRTTTLRDLQVVLDPARMLSVDEQQPGQIKASLRHPSGSGICETSTQVEVLAASQWRANPIQLGLEMLTAHVQPHAPVISTLLREASDLLGSRNNSSVLDGYQSESPERIDAMVAAIYDAARARDVRYAEPPASWGIEGQRIRTPAEVLEGRLGTCLDTTVTLAAALEQAGVNSTLWLLEKHSFLGYWRIDSALDLVASTDVSDVVNLVGLGQIGLVETTGIAGGSSSTAFLEATRAARRHLADPSSILGVADIRRAREAQIFPLPSQSMDAGGNVVVTVYEPGAGRVIEPYVSSPSARSQAPDPTPIRVSRWKNALLDLSLRNRLINYTNRAGYRLELPGRVLGRLEDTLHANASITLLPSETTTAIDTARGIQYARDLPEEALELLLADKRAAHIDITAAAYTSKLRYLAYKAKTVVEETGANNLYLAFGMLRWRFNDRDLRSPLVLVPVVLHTPSRGATYRLAIDEAGGSTPNFCLLEKLRLELGLEIPGLANPEEDSWGIDLAAAFDAVRRSLLDAGLPFHVDETVDLSILQFAKFRLWKDLDEHWEELTKNSLVAHLVNSPLEPYHDPVAPTETDLDVVGLAVPVPADASQLEAVAEAIGGRTFVLEGPPGTGKSQTITNVLARSLTSGRRVLFVAEKRAALDVVKDRLEAVGLGSLSLDLHDKSAQPAAVRAQIKAALDLHVTTDAAGLEAGLESGDASLRSLRLYAERLHQVNAAELSLYSAHEHELASDPGTTTLPVPESLVSHGTQETIAELIHVLRLLPETADLAQPSPTHPWGFIDEQPGVRLDGPTIHAAASEFDRTLEFAKNAGFSLDVLGRANSPAAVMDWAVLSSAPRYPLSVLDHLNTPSGETQLDAVERELAALSASPPSWAALAHPRIINRDLDSIHAAALAADNSGFFGRKRRRQAVLNTFVEDLLVPATSIHLKSLSRLTADLAASRVSVDNLRSAVASLPIPLAWSNWNPLLPEDAQRVRGDLSNLQWVRARVADTGNPHTTDLRRFYAYSQSGAATQELRELADAWNRLVEVSMTSRDAADRWAGDVSFLERWWSTRPARRLETPMPVTLDRWLGLIRCIEPLRRAGLNEARTAILDGKVPPDTAASAFRRGIALASVAERLDSTALIGFDPAAHNRTINRFNAATQVVRGELVRAIPARVLKMRRFDAAAASGQVGGLRRQLERRRGGMRVRALLQNYGDVITQIMPCTLMSPESVARFLPARAELFDTVVFDEASQIRVADSIGAMGRANSVVVVGDSKQMPPTSVAEVSTDFEEDEEFSAEATVADEESILSESVQARVPRKWLSWHYRSQDESLIAFSNRHYYEDRLSSFPAPLTADSREAFEGYGIAMVRVNGKFERTSRGATLRTNRIEADAIVAEIERRFWASADSFPSIGVVTFNAQQRDLIENLLRDCADDRIRKALDEPDGLFVKNLENVQGDERDCILFSIAFSANDKGVVPLNFGPLSKPGGERRLNVAITRARRQVVLFSSFDPAALRAEQATQIGTKHLKAYLELAARGVDALQDDRRRAPGVDRHRDEIAEALRAMDVVVQVDLGLSDFRVDLALATRSAPDRPLVAVLLDGPGWRARRTVADRDTIPVDVLHRLMHWPAVERVWLPEWLDDREATLARLREALNTAQHPPPGSENHGVIGDGPASAANALGPDSTVSPPVPATSNSEPNPVSARAPREETPLSPEDSYATHRSVVPYREWTQGLRGGVEILDLLPRPSAVALVRQAIGEAIETEGPIHQDRLARQVGRAFGLSRVTQARQDAIVELVPSEYRRGSDEPYLWPSGVEPANWTLARRTPDGTSRPLEQVSLIEIANAMRVVAEVTAGTAAAELKREALAIFGGRRLTEAISDRLDAGLGVAVQTGRLAYGDDGLFRAS